MKTKREIKVDAAVPVGAQGTYKVRVMNRDGTPATEWQEQKNLILPAGVTQDNYWTNMLQSCHAGTGASANKTTLDGTFSQTGTTVTRVTGSGVFVSGNVGDFIKFASGETAKITVFTNSVTVTVEKSQTVAAAALTVYDCSRLYLDTWVKATTNTDPTAGFNGSTYTTDSGTMRTWKTFNHTTETVARTYTEIGVAMTTGTTSTTTLFSRLLFDTPVNVGIDQFLQVRFDLVLTTGNYRTSASIPVTITGWPYVYNIQSITANGTYWDVVVDKGCNAHYAVGRPIIIAGALPATTVITSISSTGSDFTVNSTAHGKSPGDSIVIAGATPAGYNGAWTVATVPNANSLTVTSAANLGAGSGGTVRLATPGTWFNGTHTIASFPNATTIRITNATVIPTAGVAGTITNSLNASAIITGQSFTIAQPSILDFQTNSTALQNKATATVFPESALKTGLVHGTNPNNTGNIGSYAGSITNNLGLRTQTIVGTFGTAVIVDQTIRQIAWGNFSQGTGKLFITFDERQRKDNGFILTVGYTIKWDPDLN